MGGPIVRCRRKPRCTATSKADLLHVPLLLAQLIGGYELSSQIGEGAFSKVYLGASNDPNANPLRRQVAIKIIAVSAAAGKDSKEDYLKKLKKEVRLHKVVTHLNVLRLFQWSEGASNESLWIILEYCHGGDLFDKISKCLRPDTETTEG